ncbi:hypothetical protein BCF46_1752 [Litoreibacter meonggei]|uniref:Uncharacterized protein n=1 Tax=Litoreibacter meonggei TaxID=1049199 RepID=A0A497WEK2_9RHOB|nr:hypothetical protein [Litoreibacter meonggei]RLJ51538.1 hypothetical protein BCF46_1752 [Litoreibacter meonggei]
MSDVQMLESADRPCDLLWQLTGARSGPTLLVTGDLDVLAPIVERLQMLPSLVYLRGTLMVGSSDVTVEADEVMALRSGAPSEVYWSILARTAELGMISGRGIPANLIAA